MLGYRREGKKLGAEIENVRKSRMVAMNSQQPPFSRIAGTIIIGVCWLAFIVLYLAFFAGNFNFWQKIAIFIASGAIVAGIISVMWVKWALK